MKGESAEARRRFEKEAAILKTVKGHRNVTEFLRFCREPYAIMMEHACFDFNPLGVKKQVNSLEDFYISLMRNSTLRRSQMSCYCVRGTLFPDWTFSTRTISRTEI
ncbi:unnamed protein product [Porites lobata]|uniref:Protein kinase domain-containing protein n=1 Tax=Porites lobata TaxID=104759 RepID=A0ABN8QTD6_9CNID|nr:unnamed protein product [Porites lobata]